MARKTKAQEKREREARQWRIKSGGGRLSIRHYVNGRDGLHDTDVTITLEDWTDANNYNRRTRTYGK